MTEFFDWQQRFPEHRVMNLGIAGETVDGLLGRMDRVLLALHDPDLIFVMSGINNIAMEDHEIASHESQCTRMEMKEDGRGIAPVGRNAPW